MYIIPPKFYMSHMKLSAFPAGEQRNLASHIQATADNSSGIQLCGIRPLVPRLIEWGHFVVAHRHSQEGRQRWKVCVQDDADGIVPVELLRMTVEQNL